MSRGARGLYTARKLKARRRYNRWADKAWKKGKLVTKYKSNPLGGAFLDSDDEDQDDDALTDTEIDETIKEAIELTNYAVQTRYPGEYDDITKEEYKKAIKVTKYCLEWVNKKIKETLSAVRRAKAINAVQMIQQQSIKNGTDKITLEEINHEIKMSRKARKR